MFCPTCGYLLQKLAVTTDSGGKFEIDHCGRCGGTWFDPYEINRIPYHEVVKLAHLTVLPKAHLGEFPTHKCPRCYKTLSPYQSESTPRGVRFFRCSNCHGIFAMQKALEEFKKHQEEKITEYKTKNVAFPSLSAVFLPALFILLLFVTTFVTVSHLQETKEERIKAAEIISSIQTIPISPTSVSVILQTKVPVKSKISYGLSTLQMTTYTISGAPTTFHQILLTDLVKNTAYFYQITLEDEFGKSFTTDVRIFVTHLN